MNDKRKGNWVFLRFLCGLLFQDKSDIAPTPDKSIKGLSPASASKP